MPKTEQGITTEAERLSGTSLDMPPCPPSHEYPPAIRTLLDFLDRVHTKVYDRRSDRQVLVTQDRLRQACAEAVDLGSGTFCQAFKIDFGGSSLVIKIPKPFLDAAQDPLVIGYARRSIRRELAGILRGQELGAECLPQYISQLRTDKGELMGVLEEFIEGDLLAARVKELGRPEVERLIREFVDFIYDDMKCALWDIQLSNLRVKDCGGRPKIVMPDGASLQKLSAHSRRKEQAEYYLMREVDLALGNPVKDQ